MARAWRPTVVPGSPQTLCRIRYILKRLYARRTLLATHGRTLARALSALALMRLRYFNHGRHNKLLHLTGMSVPFMQDLRVIVLLSGR